MRKLTEKSWKSITKKKMVIMLTSVIIVIGSVLSIYLLNGLSKAQHGIENQQGNWMRLQQELSVIWDEGYVLPNPDYNSQLAIPKDFDWTQASIEANHKKAFDLVTQNENCIINETIEFENEPVTITFEVTEKGYDLYLYGGFNGALLDVEILSPEGKAWEKLPYLWLSEARVISNPKLGTWQVRFTPYPPGQSVEDLKGIFFVVQKAQSVTMKLPRTTNKSILESSEKLEGNWSFIITVNGTEIGETTTISSQEVEIPLFEGKNEVLISRTDGISNSRVTKYEVISDTAVPELTIIYPEEYIEGEPLKTDKKDFGIGVKCNELAQGYIQNKKVITESFDKGSYFGANITLKKGMNHIMIEAIDLSGNYITKTIDILFE